VTGQQPSPVRETNPIATTQQQVSVMPRESGIAGGLNSGLNTGMGAMQGFGNAGQGGNAGTMMGMQQAPAAYQFQN